MPLSAARLKETLRRRTGGFDPRHVEPDFGPMYAQCRPYTMTSPERMYGLYQAIGYIVAHDIPGAIVECGVWRGGSAMLAGLRLRELEVERDFYLYDTFEGMTQPSTLDGPGAANRWRASQRETHNEWCYASLEEVRQNMLTVVASRRLHLVKGPVETTLPEHAPEQIALLRLDTDWYESTKHELEHLYPRLVDRGVLILDDYGHWQGSRQAVDEYFGRTPPLLSRIDRGARIAIKT